MNFEHIRKKVKAEHVVEGIERLDKKPWPTPRDSDNWDLHYNGKKYPPKEVIKAAYIAATGEDIFTDDDFWGGEPSNAFLVILGFKVTSKTGEPYYPTTRKTLIVSMGAEFKNARALSFVNHDEKFVVFGAWEGKIDSNHQQLILHEGWTKSKTGNSTRKLGSYTTAISHIRLIEDEGYQLKTFIQKCKEEVGPNETPKLKYVRPDTVSDMQLITTKETKNGNTYTTWYAVDNNNSSKQQTNTSTKGTPSNNNKAMYEDAELEDIDPEDRKVIEGQFIELKVMVRKRNSGIAKICKKNDDYMCQACNFSYGGKIVECHHLRPMAHNKSSNIEVKLEDLVTLCPTCHKLAHHLIKKYGNEYTKKNTLINKLKKIRQQ